jgi:transcriptional regulator with XRE-family HTH domain
MEDSELYSRFGQLLRQHRERLGMSQAAVAQAIGLSRASVANIETGRQHIPLHHLYRLARALKVDVYALLPTINGVDALNVNPKIQSSIELSEREQEAVAKAVGSFGTSGKRGAQ